MVLETSSAVQPRGRHLSRNYHPLLPLFFVVAAVINTGSAFITLPIHAASAMSTTDNSNPGSSNSKPLAAAEGDASSSGINDSAQPSQNNCADGVEGNLQLPALPEASNDSSIPSIKLGESISFAEMGPVIINSDGTTRRIDNWDQMTKQEQEVAWRRISKRNEQRRKVLLEQQQQQEDIMEGN